MFRACQQKLFQLAFDLKYLRKNFYSEEEMKVLNGNQCIYLDYHSTTPIDEKVFLKMKPFFIEHFGNPSSSSHCFGWKAQEAIDEARISFANAINAQPTEIIFTSGATEATNMALKGVIYSQGKLKGNHIVSSTIEHSATLETLNALSALNGTTVSYVKPNMEGRIPTEEILENITTKTVLVSIFLVNNEIGTINDISLLGKKLKEKGVLLHCDAAQALGRIPIDCANNNVDLMSFSGHKIYGPKGIGALYIRKDARTLVCPIIHGGGQEWCKRSGTLNVPGIVGIGEASMMVTSDIEKENNRIRHLRENLINRLSELEEMSINATLEQRVSANLNVSFANINGDELMVKLCPHIAISSGSACVSAKAGGSYVLKEIGIEANLRQASLRFGLGRYTTEEEIERAAKIVVKSVKELRRNSRKLVRF